MGEAGDAGIFSGGGESGSGLGGSGESGSGGISGIFVVSIDV